MAIYVMLTTLTDEGRKTIRQNPERIREVNREVEAMGARIVAQYSVLGPYDFVNILEAPDNQTVARLAIELGSRGTVQTLSMPAMAVSEFVNMVLEGVDRYPGGGEPQ